MVQSRCTLHSLEFRSVSTSIRYERSRRDSQNIVLQRVLGITDTVFVFTVDGLWSPFESLCPLPYSSAHQSSMLSSCIYLLPASNPDRHNFPECTAHKECITGDRITSITIPGQQESIGDHHVRSGADIPSRRDTDRRSMRNEISLAIQ